MMSKRNGQQIHRNVLIKSKPDDVALTWAVQEKFLHLCSLYLKMKGIQLPIPTHLDADFLRWRQCFYRYKQGDLRHTDAEKRSVRTIAEWTLQIKAELMGEAVPMMDWND